MNRRRFLKNSARAAARVASAYSLPHLFPPVSIGAKTSPVNDQPNSGLVPDGERYEGEVPDTLDLSARARIAINGLTRAVDAQHDYEHYFLVMYMKDPPEMWHTGAGDMSCCNPKWSESLPMMRCMSGSSLNVGTEQKMMHAMVGMIDKDGLYSVPPARDHEAEPWRAMGRSDTCAFGNGRMMLAMIAWYERSRDPAWLKKIKKIGQGLSKTAVHKNGYAYFPCMGGSGEEAEKKILNSFDRPVCQGQPLRAQECSRAGRARKVARRRT